MSARSRANPWFRERRTLELHIDMLRKAEGWEEIDRGWCFEYRNERWGESLCFMKPVKWEVFGGVAQEFEQLPPSCA